MQHRHESISLVKQVFERLEHDILVGKYERGEVLTELKLCEELGVSRTPVREALQMLSEEHIIEKGTKGSIVIGISAKDVEDIFQIRLYIEGIAAAKTAKHITDEQLAKLKETLDLQEFYFHRKDSENSRLMDSKFHELIYAFCASAVFYDVLLPLHRKTQKYRKATFENNDLGTISIEEHKKIYEAIAAHDEQKANELTIKHVENAMKRILDGGIN